MRLRRRYKRVIVLTLLAAAVGRGWGLWHRGLMEHDEGHALLNANTWWHVMRWVLGGGLWGGDGAGTIAQLRDTLHEQGGTLYSAGKLGYSLLVAIVALPGHVSTGLALTLAWLAGCLVAVLAALLAWQYSRSRFAAVIAAGGCLTSPLLIELSREASGTIWALVFGLAGAVVINGSLASIRARWHWLTGLAGGALLGYAFSCHFNLAPFILAVYLAAAVYAWSIIKQNQQCVDGTSFSVLFKRLLPSAIGGLGMLALFEVVTQAADYVLRNSYPDFRSFSGELRHLFFGDQARRLEGSITGDGIVGWGWEALAVYGNALLREGPAWLCAMVMVLVMIARRGRRGQGTSSVVDGQSRILIVPALILLLVPALFWSGYFYRVERSLGMCMAASWILIGLVLEIIRQRIQARAGNSTRSGQVIFEILAVMQLAAGGIAMVQTAQLRSPLPDVIAETFSAPEVAGKQVTAGSFDVGFAPLWKWAIVQYQRKHSSNGNGGVGNRVTVNFANFNGAQIVFVDPSTWFQPNPDFLISRQQVESGRVIAARKSRAPEWTVWSVVVGDGHNGRGGLNHR